MPSAVTKYLGIAAVGTSTGAAFVLLPGVPAAAPGGKQQAQQPPRCDVVTAGAFKSSLPARSLDQHFAAA
jgi:hypothetical protein